MKIPKDFYRRLAQLKQTIPKLVDHTVMVMLVKENKAKYFSENGKDQGTYSVVRQEGESEADFHRRARGEAQKRFPKAQVTLVSHKSYLELGPEIEIVDEIDKKRRAETSRDFAKTQQRFD